MRFSASRQRTTTVWRNGWAPEVRTSSPATWCSNGWTVSTDRCGFCSEPDRPSPDKSQPGAGFDERLRDLVGQSLAEVSFATLDGGTRRFADLSDSVLLIHVWATWCAPCLADMPILEELEGEHPDLMVVNLSDEPVDVIKAWLAENPTGMLHGRRDDFAFLAGDGTASPDGSVVAVRPVHLVLDREAIVLEAGAGGATGSPNHLAELVEPHL